MGKQKLLEAVEEAVKADLGEDEFVQRLYDILDTNTLPEQNGQDFETYTYHLRESIFIPSFGSAEAPQDVLKAGQIASSEACTLVNGNTTPSSDLERKLKEAERPDAETRRGTTGIYGTQRQTIVLVDWEGSVTFFERSLWDAEGKPIERGLGDMKFDFKIEGWNKDSKGNEFYPRCNGVDC